MTQGCGRCVSSRPFRWFWLEACSPDIRGAVPVYICAPNTISRSWLLYWTNGRREFYTVIFASECTTSSVVQWLAWQTAWLSCSLCGHGFESWCKLYFFNINIIYFGKWWIILLLIFAVADPGWVPWVPELSQIFQKNIYLKKKMFTVFFGILIKVR